MDRILNSLSGRLVCTAVVVNAVLAPVLFAGITALVRQSHEEIFIDEIRHIGRVTADAIESQLDTLPDTRIVELLDSVAFRDGTFAELIRGKHRLSNSLSARDITGKYIEDFEFGGHGDNTYFFSIAVGSGPRSAVLRLGFDEQPMAARIQAAQTRIAFVFLIFIGSSIVLITILAVWLTRPLRILQKTSEEIAAGKYHGQIKVRSNINEIKHLAQSLELIHNLRMKLRQTQKLETMGVFAGGIAHELNNILLPVRFYAEMAIEQLAIDSPIRRDLDKLVNAVKRAGSLVRKILRFSHQGVQSTHSVVVLRPIIEDALQLIRAVLPPSITLTYAWQAGDIRVVADASEIHQVVMNLCTNAYQAMSRCGGTLSIAVELRYLDEEQARQIPDLAPGQYALLCISDTGDGIDPLTLEHLFEPFFTTRGVGEGVGLGLSVVHGIVLSHNGNISVNSSPGTGASFEVLLPQYTGTVE